MKEQIIIMLDMQDRMNQKVHANWQEQGFEWYRAIWIESAELMEHQGWKWWKKQAPDRDQVILELVDIWHFGLSDFLQLGRSTDDIAESVIEQFEHTPGESNEDFLALVERFAAQVLAEKRFVLESFVPLLNAVGVSFDQLYRHYVGKNVLNFFRQDNGYKAGTYIKIWDEREDNEHLAEIVRELDSNVSDFAGEVYNALTARYQAVVV